MANGLPALVPANIQTPNLARVMMTGEKIAGERENRAMQGRKMELLETQSANQARQFDLTQRKSNLEIVKSQMEILGKVVGSVKKDNFESLKIATNILRQTKIPHLIDVANELEKENKNGLSQPAIDMVKRIAGDKVKALTDFQFKYAGRKDKDMTPGEFQIHQKKALREDKPWKPMTREQQLSFEEDKVKRTRKGDKITLFKYDEKTGKLKSKLPNLITGSKRYDDAIRMGYVREERISPPKLTKIEYYTDKGTKEVAWLKEGETLEKKGITPGKKKEGELTESSVLKAITDLSLYGGVGDEVPKQVEARLYNDYLQFRKDGLSRSASLNKVLKKVNERLPTEETKTVKGIVFRKYTDGKWYPSK